MGQGSTADLYISNLVATYKYKQTSSYFNGSRNGILLLGRGNQGKLGSLK